MVDTIEYLTRVTLPMDKGKAKKCRAQVVGYVIITGELYQ